MVNVLETMFRKMYESLLSSPHEYPLRISAYWRGVTI